MRFLTHDRKDGIWGILKSIFSYSSRAQAPGRTDHGGKQVPGFKTLSCPMTLPRNLHFLVKLYTNYMGFLIVVVVRKNFSGPVGFFYGKHFGAELTMEIPELTSGKHR
jgi:hypothetical protein